MMTDQWNSPECGLILRSLVSRCLQYLAPCADSPPRSNANGKPKTRTGSFQRQRKIFIVTANGSTSHVSRMASGITR